MAGSSCTENGLSLQTSSRVFTNHQKHVALTRMEGDFFYNWSSHMIGTPRHGVPVTRGRAPARDRSVNAWTYEEGLGTSASSLVNAAQGGPWPQRAALEVHSALGQVQRAEEIEYPAAEADED
eukprot:1079924-Pyramimonas_sp.AAC.1